MEKRLLAPDLYKYLLSLSSTLAEMGEANAARQVTDLSRFASGSTSELYGEAKRVLPQILANIGKKLSESERARLEQVVAGIDAEFARIGGA